MNKSVCRVGDVGQGICTLHDTVQNITVTLLSGDSDILTDGLSTCTVGSTGIASCGHSTVALTGSSTCTVNGKGSHRVGDQGTTGGGYYIMTTGSDIVESDD